MYAQQKGHQGGQESFGYNPEVRTNIRDSYKIPAEHKYGPNNYEEPLRYSRNYSPISVQDRYQSLNASRSPYPP